MKPQNKKGFTIVELVIVIAVIAILAAILVPVISNIVKRAHVTKDSQLVRNLNTALAVDTSTPKHETMQSALDAAAQSGYNVGKINASATDNLILWDSVNDVFCYVEKAEDGTETIAYIPESVKGTPLTIGDYRLWVISDTVSDTYSTYYIGNATVINTSKGFDAGTCSTISNINYTNTGVAQDVVIRTNGGTLTVNAPLDKVHHYGSANVVDIVTVASTSYYEHETAIFVKVKKGRFVVTEAAAVGGVHAVASTDNASNKFYDNIKIAVVGNATMPNLTRDAASIDEKTAEGNYSQYVLEIQTVASVNSVDDNPEFVWANITIADNGAGLEKTESSAVVSKADAGVAFTEDQKSSAEVKTSITVTSASVSDIADKVAEAVEMAVSERNAETAATNVVEPVFNDTIIARIGTTGYTSFAQAIESAAAGDTVKLIADDTVSLTGATAEKIITIDKNLTVTGAVDANGAPLYTIFGTPNYVATRNAIVISGTCEVTLSNIILSEFGNEAATGSYAGIVRSESANGNLTIRNVTISKINRDAILIKAGQFMIDGCNINCNKSSAYGEILTKGIEVQGSAHGTIQNTTITGVTDTYENWASSGIELYNTSNTLIKNCSITSMSTGIGPQDSAVVVIEDCTILSVGEGIVARKNADITINGGTITVSGSNGKGIWTYSTCTRPVVVNGTTITAVYAFYISSSTGGGLTITDGTFSGKLYKFGANSVCNISGGSFITDYQLGLGTGASGPVLSGGSFSRNYAQYTYVEGYAMYVSNGVYVVLPIQE